MLTLSERVERDLKRLALLKGQRKTRQLIKKSVTPDDYTRLLIILGGLVVDHFPVVLGFQPQETEAENNAEFAPVAALLAKLAADTEYVNSLIEEVMQAFT